MDNRFLKKMISTDVRKINRAVVKDRLTLTKLINMPEPFATTIDGVKYLFDKETIKKLDEIMPPSLKDKVKFPLIFYQDIGVNDSYYIIETDAYEMLSSLGDLTQCYSFRNDKLWFSKPIGFLMSKKYPTMVQFMVTSSSLQSKSSF